MKVPAAGLKRRNDWGCWKNDDGQICRGEWHAIYLFKRENIIQMWFGPQRGRHMHGAVFISSGILCRWNVRRFAPPACWSPSAWLFFGRLPQVNCRGSRIWRRDGVSACSTPEDFQNGHGPAFLMLQSVSVEVYKKKNASKARGVCSG